MKLVIGGKEEAVSDGLTVTGLLMEKKVSEPAMVSVELNERILSRNEFDSIVLKDGDRVEFLYFMGGGAR